MAGLKKKVDGSLFQPPENESFLRPPHHIPLRERERERERERQLHENVFKSWTAAPDIRAVISVAAPPPRQDIIQKAVGCTMVT
jgi:hypothetical protein